MTLAYARWGKTAPRLFLSAVLGLSALGCVALTREEALEAVEEAQLCSQALTLIGTTVTLTENFTIGQAVEDAADNLYDFYKSQLPCAEVSVQANTLSVQFGKTGDTCTHQGMKFKGSHEITISRDDMNAIIVDHVWTDLQNGTLSVSGTAQVTWDGTTDPSRRVEHDLIWTRLEDRRTGRGTGDRIQRPLDGDLSQGIVVTGDANWEGESGLWELDISEVEMRWVDPVPQAGRYNLETPFNKSLTLDFERTEPNNIHITAKSGARSFEFDIFALN